MKLKDKNDTIENLSLISIDADPSHLSRIFGFRFNRAWELLEKRKIVKYIFKPNGRVRWIVEGKSRGYLILKNAGYCACDDFFFKTVYGKCLGCQHLIAQRLGEALGDYVVREVNDSQYDKMMDHWRKDP